MMIPTERHAPRQTAAWFIAWLVLLGIGLLFRTETLDMRPLHTDEAVQGMKTAHLLESGEYAYDPSHFHGPSLYYLAVPVAWIRGQTDTRSLDATTLRLVPLLAGLALAVSLFLFREELGWPGIIAGTGLLMFSPGLTYFSTYYIQELLLTAGLVAFIGCAWRYRKSPSGIRALGMGLSAGFMLATKETALPYLALAIGVGTLATLNAHPGPVVGRKPFRRHAIVAILSGLIVCLVLYSSFGSNPRGIVDAVRGLFIYEPVPGHEKPWIYYLQILVGWDRKVPFLQGESLLLYSGIAAAAALPFLTPEKAARQLALILITVAALTLLAFSWLDYKTPWLLLEVLALLGLMGALGFAALWNRFESTAIRGILLLGLLGIFGGLLKESLWTTQRFPVEPRNPYAYVHTGWDAVALAERINAVMSVAPAGTTVKVMASEYWPLPWYLKSVDSVGYWHELPADPYAPVMVVSSDLVTGLDPDVLEDYVPDFRGLRPGVIVLLYVHRDLWEIHARSGAAQ